MDGTSFAFDSRDPHVQYIYHNVTILAYYGLLVDDKSFYLTCSFSRVSPTHRSASEVPGSVIVQVRGHAYPPAPRKI